MIALALLLQAAAAPSPGAPTLHRGAERFSILTDPCAAASNDGGDVVVCARADNLQPRIPLPRYRGVPDHAVPSNPDMKASVALDGPGIGTECDAYGEGCPIAGGGSGYIGPMTVAAGAVGLAKRALSKRHYKDKGVSIPLDDPTPPAPGSMAARILP